MNTADNNHHKEVELSSILRRAGDDTEFALTGGGDDRMYKVVSVNYMRDLLSGLPFVFGYSVKKRNRDGKWSEWVDDLKGDLMVKPSEVELVRRINPEDMGIREKVLVKISDWRHSRLIRRVGADKGQPLHATGS